MTEIYDKVTEKVKTFIEDSEASVFGFCDLGRSTIFLFLN